MNPTILAFWDNQSLRGQKPQPVYSIISKGGIQPKGYCIGWALTKRRAMEQLHRYAEHVGGVYCIVRMAP